MFFHQASSQCCPCSARLSRGVLRPFAEQNEPARGNVSRNQRLSRVNNWLAVARISVTNGEGPSQMSKEWQAAKNDVVADLTAAEEALSRIEARESFKLFMRINTVREEFWRGK